MLRIHESTGILLTTNGRPKNIYSIIIILNNVFFASPVDAPTLKSTYS